MNWSEQTMRAMCRCVCCPRQCGADRANGQKGLCGAGLNVSVARAMPHFYEEPCISGSRGSGTVFFRGCSLRCVFCQNDEISRAGDAGQGLSLDALCETVDGLARRGVHNISFVTPTHYAFQIADALRYLQLPMPVVWNSGGYDRPETVEMLGESVDIWLPDLKFAGNAAAARFTAVRDYADFAFPAVRRMAELAGPARFDGEGMMTRGVLVRHLCLPGMTGQSKRVLDWIGKTLGASVKVSLMRQYVPAGRAKEMPPLNRKLSGAEYERVFDYMVNLGLADGFVQDDAAAEEGYVPSFNGEGVAGDWMREERDR